MTARLATADWDASAVPRQLCRDLHTLCAARGFAYSLPGGRIPLSAEVSEPTTASRPLHLELSKWSRSAVCVIEVLYGTYTFKGHRHYCQSLSVGPSAFGTAGTQTVNSIAVTTENPHIRALYTDQYSLGVQHEFGKAALVEVSYQGSRTFTT